MKPVAPGGKAARASGPAAWLAALGVGGETGFERAAASGGPDSEWGEGPSPDDSRFTSRQARRPTGPHDSAQRRVFRTYLAARAVLGLALLVAQAAIAWLGSRESSLLLGVCAAYAVQSTLVWWWWPRRATQGIASRSSRPPTTRCWRSGRPMPVGG